MIEPNTFSFGLTNGIDTTLKLISNKTEDQMNLTNKSLLITGGTGSFGYRMTRYLLDETDIDRIIIFSRDEYKQFIMQQEFLNYKDRMRFFIGDVRDQERLNRAFNGVDYVVHAAAMKQVPACEYNPIEAIKTNIDGATNVINASLDSKSVKKVVALSTDKAVNPINLYGGTKLVSDKLFAAANNYSGKNGCRFAIVRYGNVAGSRGSIIPFFKEKLFQGEKNLPLTDKRMTRFWMTLDDAVLLVMKTFDMAKGGETFVYKNPSFHIKDLIEAMSGHSNYNEIGIREGEKLHECMVTTADSRFTYEYNDYYVIYPNYNWWNSNNDIIPGGVAVPQDWEYTSNTNNWWLSVDELKTKIDEIEL